MDKLIVALDVFSFEEMQTIVENLGQEVSIYKVGLQLHTSEGPRVITYLKRQKKTVFLDLKLHEISNSVAQAIRAAAKHGVDIVTVHASGGSEMMEAAVHAANEFPAMKVLALTVVTGLGDEGLKEVGVNSTTVEQVLRLATLALNSGCHGVVASAKEVSLLRAKLGGKFLIVTPGIRPLGADANEQTRVGTPRQSIEDGASAIVVGRPITQAQEPVQVVVQISEELYAKDPRGKCL